MAEKTTIARPYAKATFELARESGDLKEWSEFLAHASIVAESEGAHALLGNPALKRSQIAEIFLDLCGDGRTQQQKNFVHVLAENGRLDVVPEIAQEFETLRAAHEQVLDVDVTTAIPLDDSRRDAFQQALARHYGKTVRLNLNVDPALIGGAVIRAGDSIVDGSVSGKLQRLTNVVGH